MTGLTLVYTIFQIPLMVIVFLPALDGLRQEWYDASASLGGSSWSFWRHVGGPILAPSFLGRGPAAVRQRVLGVRDGGRARLPGQPRSCRSRSARR